MLRMDSMTAISSKSKRKGLSDDSDIDGGKIADIMRKNDMLGKQGYCIHLKI